MINLKIQDNCVYADYSLLCDEKLFEQFTDQLNFLISENKCSAILIYAFNAENSRIFSSAAVNGYLSCLSCISILASDDFSVLCPELIFMFDIRLGSGVFTVTEKIKKDNYPYDFDARYKKLFGQAEYEKMADSTEKRGIYESQSVIHKCCDENEFNMQSAEKYMHYLTGNKTMFQLQSILKCYSYIKRSDSFDAEKMSEEELRQFILQTVRKEQ